MRLDISVIQCRAKNIQNNNKDNNNKIYINIAKTKTITKNNITFMRLDMSVIQCRVNNIQLLPWGPPPLLVSLISFLCVFSTGDRLILTAQKTHKMLRCVFMFKNSGKIKRSLQGSSVKNIHKKHKRWSESKNCKKNWSTIVLQCNGIITIIIIIITIIQNFFFDFLAWSRHVDFISWKKKFLSSGTGVSLGGVHPVIYYNW